VGAVGKIAGAWGLAVAVAALAAGAWPARAAASVTQTSVFQDPAVLGNPGEVREMRHLGVRVIRQFIRWSSFAPAPSSRRRPRFNAADPASYPGSDWRPYDLLVQAAANDGVALMLTVTGGAPQWADGPGEPLAARRDNLYAWRPNVSQFGQFVRAVAERYSGRYVPPGAAGPLPAVRYWEIYNEPNFGEDLAPQAIDGSRVLSAPTVYRAIVAAAWAALMATGHRHDTILLGGLAARGARLPPGPGAPQGLPGDFGTTKPLQFVRALYCLDDRYHEYRGAAARARGCPSTSAASRRFRAQNPGLFDASGFAIHPYPLGRDETVPPNRTSTPDPDDAALSQLPHLEAALDRVLRTYGSSVRMPLWNTEYGYITNPPNSGGVSPATQAYYLNWAEYLSWRDPRVRSFSQYLLEDPNPTEGTPEYGGFASGLVSFRGGPKPAYDAWRLPIFLPSTSARAGRPLWVWGCVRAAWYAFQDTHQPQRASIEFQPRGSARLTTLRTIVADGPSCYFNVPVRIPASGTVRLLYQYPPADARLYQAGLGGYLDPFAPAESRGVAVTVRAR
jgi:hypothetical protein